MRFGWLIVLLAGLSVAAPAADISGKWTAKTFMSGGGADMPVPTTFTFKVEGAKLTGAMTSASGEFEILDGKVAGDSVTFTVVVAGAKMLYDGRITEQGIDFIVKVADRDRSDQFLATRVAT